MAGSAGSSPVDIDFVAKSAIGSKSAARFSDNDVESIGCAVTARGDDLTTTLLIGRCRAVDANGDEAYCFTNNLDMIDVIRGISAFDSITFAWNDDDVDDIRCTQISNAKFSNTLPDFKLEKKKK
ncbi:hypothetical protein ACFL00_03605 [Pseudomonadota bacterium]